MRELPPLDPGADLSGPWCDGDAATTAVLEAVSFVTPALERFFIRSMAAALSAQDSAGAVQRCRAFIREEALHTRAHRRLNRVLLLYLQRPPPGLASVEWLLDAAQRRLRLPARMALVTTLEHFAAVLSVAYLERQSAWHFDCDFARDLFAAHAGEEIGHRAVAFDAWSALGGGGGVPRAAAMAATLFVGGAYLALAVPWILRRKAARGLLLSLRGPLPAWRTSPSLRRSLRDLFAFVRGGFHPRRLSADVFTADAGCAASPKTR